MSAYHRGQQDRYSGTGSFGDGVLCGRRGEDLFSFVVARKRSGRAVRGNRRAASRQGSENRRAARSENSAHRASERGKIVAAQPALRNRTLDRRFGAGHHAGFDRCAARLQGQASAADRYRGNSSPSPGRRRTRTGLGGPRDRSYPARRCAAAGDRCDRRNYRSGRAPGASGRHQRSRDGPGVQQMGRRGESGWEDRRLRLATLCHRFPFLEYATIVFTSALTGDGVNETHLRLRWRLAKRGARVTRPRCSTRSSPPRAPRWIRRWSIGSA